MMTSRIGAVHLGRHVLAVAAGGGGIDIRPLKVEGVFSPPAYLLADAMGRLHTGSHGDPRGLAMAIEDVRDVVGFREIVIAGATWPAASVFQARLFNPLAEITRYLGAADVVALPVPHDWSDDKVDTYCELVSTLGVVVDPLPESVALAAYVRATEFVESGITAVYCDGRSALVVAVYDDPDRPTESVDIPVRDRAATDPAAADRMVYDLLAAARSVGAQPRRVVLTGPVCFNDSIRLALRNHLGTRLRVADHPMHAIALGAVDLLHRDEEAAETRGDDRFRDGRAEMGV